MTRREDHPGRFPGRTGHGGQEGEDGRRPSAGDTRLPQGPERYRVALVERSRECAGATDVGPVRERNEDAYWLAEDGALLVVADGLGGLPAGDVASALAVEAVEEFFDANGRDAAEGALRKAADFAQERILYAARERAAFRGMATTIVVAVVAKDAVSVLHVGDSRAALWRSGSLLHSTYDHNGVGDMVRSGAITFDEARHYPGRNLVREVLGLGDGFEAEWQQWALESGDILLLCTDGLTEGLDDVAVARILASAPSAAAAAATLVALAGVEGGRDNATAIVRYVP